MKPQTEVWVEIAEGDFATAEWLLESPHPLPRSVGFSAQQCVEKYLKAMLEEVGRPVPRTHDLGALLALLADLLPSLAPYRPAIEAIVPFAGVLRYPYDEGLFPDMDDDAERAAATMRTVRSIVRAALGIAPAPSAADGG